MTSLLLQSINIAHGREFLTRWGNIRLRLESVGVRPAPIRPLGRTIVTLRNQSLQAHLAGDQARARQRPKKAPAWGKLRPCPFERTWHPEWGRQPGPLSRFIPSAVVPNIVLASLYENGPAAPESREAQPLSPAALARPNRSRFSVPKRPRQKIRSCEFLCDQEV